MLRASGLVKHYGGVAALDAAGITVERGEVHALVGENGAGKSTLVKIISGAVRPDGGTVELDDASVAFTNTRQAAEQGIAIVSQELMTYPDLTVLENLFPLGGPGRFGLVSTRTMERRAAPVLAELGLSVDPRARVETLSLADRQLLEICRALLQEPRVLILDEPTSALPRAAADRLAETTRRLAGRGLAVLYISHFLGEVMRIAQRVTVLRDGAHIATKRVADTTATELVQLMVGRKIESLFPKITVPIGEPVLELKDLERRPLTKRISLTVRAGEIVGLAGLVGSGRSELAHTIFGVTPAEGGEVKIRGQVVDIRSPAQARALGIGYVPEDRGTQGLVRAMTVRENFSLAALGKVAFGGFIDRASERKLAGDGVKRFAVKASSLEQVAGKLSGGNQQKIVLGKWLANQPKLLILDEPTRGIDVGAKAEIHRLMGELAAQGLAILMISSELPEVLGMSDRVLVMREGHIVAEFPREEATQEAVGAAMMGNHESVEKVA